MLKLYFRVLCTFVLFSAMAFSQSNPIPFDLSSGNYTFSEWDPQSSVGTYPANMIFIQTSKGDPLLNDEPESDYACVYNRTSQTRVTGIGGGGVYFVNTGDPMTQTNCQNGTVPRGFVQGAVVSLNTTGRAGITVKWTNEVIQMPAEQNNYAIRLQYRVGTTGNWIDVLNTNNNPIEYVPDLALPAGQARDFEAKLPSAAENKSVVQVRWKYYHLGVTGGARPWIRLDDIDISSVVGDFSLTYPEAFDLSSGNFNFSSWDANSQVATYPNNMVFHQTTQLDPGLDVEPSSNYACVYNRTSQTRITGLGDNGIYFVNTGGPMSSSNCQNANSTPGFVLGAVVAINTTNRASINVKWLNEVIQMPASNNNYSMRLQYRLGETGEWKSIFDANNNPVEYNIDLTQPAGQLKSFDVKLPRETENKSLVQLRWKYYHLGAGSGARPWIRLDDIDISSQSLIGTATRLEIVDFQPANPVQNLPFSLTVRSVDNQGNPKFLTQNTNITISENAVGTLNGTTTGTINSGDYQVTFSGLTYNQIGNVLFTAQAGGGQNLANGNASASFVAGPTQFAVSALSNKIHISGSTGQFTVTAQNANAQTMASYNGYPVTLSIISGPGAFKAGVVTNSMAQFGIATFSGMEFTTAGTYTIRITPFGFPALNPIQIVVNPDPQITTLRVPAYIRSNTSNQRIPSYTLVELNNLHPNTVYRYFGKGYNIVTDPADTNGKGNPYFYNHLTNSYNYEGDNELNVPGAYSTFETGANQTTKKVWVTFMASNNPDFAPGQNLNWLVYLGNDNGAFVGRYDLGVENQSRAINLGFNTDEASVIADANPNMDNDLQRLYIVSLFDNELGTGKPLTTTMVQPDGANGFSTGAFYTNFDKDFNNSANENTWVTFIPNRNVIGGGGATSVRRIEIHDHNGNLIKSATSPNGIWDGINTNNPAYGTSIDPTFNPLIRLNTPHLEITSPITGAGVTEICNDGSIIITWNSNGISNINILVSSNGGQTFETIANNVNAHLGTYEWFLPYDIYTDKNTVIRLSATNINLISDAENIKIYDAPDIIVQDRGIVKCLNDIVELSVLANGTDLSYQWFKDGIALTDAGNMSGSQQSILRFNRIQFGQGGVYTCQVTGKAVCSPDMSQDIALYIARNTMITRQPTNQIVSVGGVATLTFDAHINGIPPGLGIEIQWFANNQPLTNDNRHAGVNANVLTIRNVNASDFNNTYRVRVRGLCNPDWVWSDEVKFESIDLNASINGATLDLCSGNTIVYASTVALSPVDFAPITYQWKKNGLDMVDGGNIIGSRSGSLTIQNVSKADEGTYTLEIGLQGYDYKAMATGENVLNVDTKPVLVTDVPASVTLEAGKELTLSVLANANVVNYEWWKDGVQIPSANDKDLSIFPLTTGDAGTYQARMYNSCGEIYSQECIVTVSQAAITSVPFLNGEGMSIVPNPASHQTVISFENEIAGTFFVKLTDAAGYELFGTTIEKATSGKVTINLDVNRLGLASGAYFIMISDGRTIHTERLNVIR